MDGDGNSPPGPYPSDGESPRWRDKTETTPRLTRLVGAEILMCSRLRRYRDTALRLSGLAT